ncbi:hypothetical protein [Nonomuraea wenchangensis]|uniref:Uncharacterized protein n=1 Tax=Nonomuraea wenchangensis TaxID=568860 RepID=A0A1I0LTM8_9ACTN|nr:hypothetical protein [Nonomuraea wenchangensis]SEU46412.1 hypothetical protein SAMN05421811_12727 [Nonomuraea wenchangensis]
MATTTSAVAVLTKALARPNPTPHLLLRALRAAGLEVTRTADRPAWMPTTPDAYALVKQAADWHIAGLTPQEIAGRMRRSTRMINRYLAAAAAIPGLLDPFEEQR